MKPVHTLLAEAPHQLPKLARARRPGDPRGLVLIRVAERRPGLTWRGIEIELGRLHAVTLSGTAGTVVQTTPRGEAQAGILRACRVTPPPRVTTLHPAARFGMSTCPPPAEAG